MAKYFVHKLVKWGWIFLGGLIIMFGCQPMHNSKPIELMETDSMVVSPTLSTSTVDPILVADQEGIISPIEASSSTPSPTVIRSSTPEPSDTPRPTTLPGSTKVSNIDGMTLVYIPAGVFNMGSTETNIGSDYDEYPQHVVSLEAFWINQTVVTNSMYAKFLNAMGNQSVDGNSWLDAGDEDVLIVQRYSTWQPVGGFENHPAVEVSWFGAKAYCQWVGGRLPSEAEWEYAARGTDGRIYPWGDGINCENAQYANCSGTLLPVDSKPAGASPFGVLGLSGNVWEWVGDWYSDDYFSESPEIQPPGPKDGVTRVLRGGSWEYDWKHLRAANRRNNGPAVSMHDYGFRCVLDWKHSH